MKQNPSSMELIDIDEAYKRDLIGRDEFNKPCCVKHGAMNRVSKDYVVYRCLAFNCHLGVKTD